MIKFSFSFASLPFLNQHLNALYSFPSRLCKLPICFRRSHLFARLACHPFLWFDNLTTGSFVSADVRTGCTRSSCEASTVFENKNLIRILSSWFITTPYRLCIHVKNCCDRFQNDRLREQDIINPVRARFLESLRLGWKRQNACSWL